jgi:excinuclease ABC subunit C
VTSAPARLRPAAVRRLPSGPGVYRFRDANGRVLYVGRATALRHRVGSYWSDLRDRRHLRRMVASVDRIEAVACDSVHEAAWLERNLLETSMPPWNRTPGGQESLVYLRISHRPSPRPLSVAYRRRPAPDGQYFGPYLGGVKVRRAVTGLYRALPLGDAGTALRGAHLDLARARGRPAPGDPGRALATLAALLDRQPAAMSQVRAELEQARDRAAAKLAFEFAARVQGELAAVDWITGPQRVTSLDPAGLDVYGWAGGTLVHFGIRAGRLCQWSQRACPRAAAAGPLDRTPAAWAPFATVNAELAATLAG